MYTTDRAKWTVYAMMRTKYPEKAKLFKTKLLKTVCIPEDNNGWKTAFYGDESITYKRFFPFYFTEEEKEEFIDGHWKHIYSLYDCTGLWFTRSIDFFRTDSGTWVYHFMGLDI